GRTRRASAMSTTTMAAQTAKRSSTRAGTPRISVGRLAMESRGQTRHAPNSRKQATTSSAAFIGWPDYSPEGPRRRSGPLAGRADEPAQDQVLEAGLELVGDLPGHPLRVGGPPALRAGGPGL